MVLFFKRPSETEEEEYITHVVECETVAHATSEIKSHALAGRVLISASGCDTIEILTALLNSLKIIYKVFAQELLNDIRDTQEYLYNTIDQLNTVLNERS